MPDPVPIALFGAAGRMGREVMRAAATQDKLRIVHGYDTAHAGEIIDGLTLERPPANLPHDVRLAIDFSTASAVREHVALCRTALIPYLCAVTGLNEGTINDLHAAALDIPLIHAPNLSPAMNLMFSLARQAAKALQGYERHIFELHHQQKRDIPSGTALRLEDAVREALDQNTPITALRVGDVVGEHTLLFGGPGERLEITHHADSRAVFASGALRAATWLLEKRTPGQYTMADVLGL